MALHTNEKVSPGTLIKIRYPPGQLDKAHFSGELAPEDYTEKFFHYWVGKGKSSRETCRGCGKLMEKEDLRIKTNLLCIYTCSSSQLNTSVKSTLVAVAFCLETRCLKKGLTRYKEDVRTTIHMF